MAKKPDIPATVTLRQAIMAARQALYDTGADDRQVATCVALITEMFGLYAPSSLDQLLTEVISATEDPLDVDKYVCAITALHALKR